MLVPGACGLVLSGVKLWIEASWLALAAVEPKARAGFAATEAAPEESVPDDAPKFWFLLT
ncbi:Uncharacterised protein [uncultured archaeon]|nr:Uncharacterised protein [uncultured archaeon]